MILTLVAILFKIHQMYSRRSPPLLWPAQFMMMAILQYQKVP